MGADNHTTTRVGGVDRETIASRMAGDLQDLESVAVAEVPNHGTPRVRFELHRGTHALPAPLMAVLAEHGATLSGLCLEMGDLGNGGPATARPPR